MLDAERIGEQARLFGQEIGAEDVIGAGRATDNETPEGAPVDARAQFTDEMEHPERAGRRRGPFSFLLSFLLLGGARRAELIEQPRAPRRPIRGDRAAQSTHGIDGAPEHLRVLAEIEPDGGETERLDLVPQRHDQRRRERFAP